MEIIRKLSEMISDEIADADRYATMALKHKADNPTLAETFYRLSAEEMNHMNMLHDQVVRMIDLYRRENGEPPEPMMAVYGYLHGKHIDDSASVKAKQSMYK